MTILCTIEYIDISGVRWRVQFTPDTSENGGMRIVSKQENGEWIVTGREPVSDISVESIITS